MSQDGGHLGASAALRELRARWLLRLIQEQARHQTRPRNRPSDRQVSRAWRELDVLLRRRRDVRSRLSGECSLGFGSLDFDHLTESVDCLDGVVEGDRAVRRNQIRDFQVVAAPFRPHQRRHSKDAALHGLGVFPGQGREIALLDIALEAGDVELGSLGDQPMGRPLVDRKVVFVPGSLEPKPEPLASLDPLGAGGGGRQERGQALGVWIPFPYGRLSRPLAGIVVLAQREKSKVWPDPPRLLHVRQPHGSPVGPGTEEVDVDRGLAKDHPIVECTRAAEATCGVTSVIWSHERSLGSMAVEVRCSADRDGYRCTVDVSAGGSTSHHIVRVAANDLERWGRGRSVDELVRASFDFLLAREPKESILKAFDLAVIKRYFPDYDG